MDFPKLSQEDLIKKIKHPGRKIRMVLDTDTYNEVDDQFALAYALKSPQEMSVEAIYAAPFHNDRSTGPKDGMEKSYQEIFKILNLMGIKRKEFVFKGSTGYLEDVSTAKDSEAVQDLIKKAKQSSEDDPLYVVAIGAITNVASAILREPGIIKKIVVIWLGGNSFNWPNTKEFNLIQDVHASRLIFDCGVPLIQLPCMGVVSHLHTSVPELEQFLYGKSELGSYLTDIVRNYTDDLYGWSKIIWDIATIAWLINPDWVNSSIVHSPILTDQGTWSFNNQRHFIRSATYLNRDRIFADMFRKLSD